MESSMPMSGHRPKLAVYANEWGLGELPRRPSGETWSFGQCLEKIAEAGFDGCQASVGRAAAVRAAGLRFCTSARVNTPAEADAVAAEAAAVSADCVTLHAGWGMETDAEMDALADAITTAADRHGIATYVETHRATMTQDVFRTNALLARHPRLAINGDYSHYYCGQELLYRGFETTRDYLNPILDRVGFCHGRVSDGQCMQCDLTDPANARHVDNFRWLWTESMARWLARGSAGSTFIFAPELGPPSSGYSITVPTPAGDGRAEIGDRWEQTLILRDLARQSFAAAVATTEVV